MAKNNFEEYEETLKKMGFDTYAITNVMTVQTRGADIKNALMFRTVEPVPLALAVKENTLYLFRVKDNGFFKSKLTIPQENIDTAIKISSNDVVSAKRTKAKFPYKIDPIQVDLKSGSSLNFYLYKTNETEVFQCFAKWGVKI